MLRPGMALEAPMRAAAAGEPGTMPRRRSMLGIGEPGAMREPVSARDAGVGIIDVASPNRASMSSSLTPAVSG